ncbi:MAG: hypothetical protein K9M08_13900 [Pirellula sp.]|jgi:hypothetical protein|nr:hypothetical protein [Pirellula sp.]
METKRTSAALDQPTSIEVGSRKHPGKPSEPSDPTNRKLGGELSQPFLWRSASFKTTNSTQWPLGADSASVESKSK